MDKPPPPYSENAPAYHIQAAGAHGVPANVNPSLLPYAAAGEPHFGEKPPQQKQPGQPDIGFQPTVQYSHQNVAGGAPNPTQIGGNQPHILFEVPRCPPENAYTNVSSDTNALAPPSYNEDDHSDAFAQFNFDDRSIRRAFIKKVYSIVMVQLLVTMVFIAIFLYDSRAMLFVYRNPAIFYFAIGLYFVTAFSMACCESPRRVFPYNFIFLGVFTICLSLMMGIISSSYNASEVLMAAGVTAAICLALTLFAFQTKYDFTGAGAYLFCIFIPLFFFGIFAMASGSPSLRLLYSALGVVLFSCYLVYDTQLMIGGKHKYSISPEDYVFAALTIYLDVMNIFVKILSLMKK